MFTDPHPMSPEGEETPFYKKGKTPRDQSPAVAEEEVTSTIDKMRLEGIIHFDIDGNDPFFMETSIIFKLMTYLHIETNLFRDKPRAAAAASNKRCLRQSILITAKLKRTIQTKTCNI